MQRASAVIIKFNETQKRLSHAEEALAKIDENSTAVRDDLKFNAKEQLKEDKEALAKTF